MSFEYLADPQRPAWSACPVSKRSPSNPNKPRNVFSNGSLTLMADERCLAEHRLSSASQ